MWWSPITISAFVLLILAATIAYTALLHRRLSELQNSREDLKNLLRNFYDSINIAQKSITTLRETTTQTVTTIQNENKKAKEVCNDLSFLIERAEFLKNQLEKSSHTPNPSLREDEGSSPHTTSHKGKEILREVGNLR